MAVPNIFGTATAAIPLSQLDTNFATAITLGNTAVYLGNTTTSLGNVTLTNVTISSGNVTVTGANISGTANVSTLIITGNQTSLGNVSITGNVSANIATFGAGTAALPAITTTGDTNTGIFFPAADTIAFAEGGVEAARIDSSGNVGIGVTPSAWSTTLKPIEIGNIGTYIAGRPSGNQLDIGVNNYYNAGYKYANTGVAATQYEQTAGTHAWYYAASGTAGNAITFTQAMTLDASGNLGIGTTTPSTKLQVGSVNVGSSTLARLSTNTSGTPEILVLENASNRSVDRGSQISFYNPNGTGTSQLGAAVFSANESATADYLGFKTGTGGTITERMRIDSSGNAQLSTGAVMPYAPAPAAISAATTLTNANIQGQIISATGTTYTITMPLGTTLETLATWATTNISYDFYVVNTASGIITMAVNTGVTSLGSLTVAIAASAHFRIRRTAANTFVLYRLS